jgi:hypothetical protein
VAAVLTSISGIRATASSTVFMRYRPRQGVVFRETQAPVAQTVQVIDHLLDAAAMGRRIAGQFSILLGGPAKQSPVIRRRGMHGSWRTTSEVVDGLDQCVQHPAAEEKNDQQGHGN